MNSPQTNPPDEITQALANLPLFMSVRQAAAFLGVSAATIREMVKHGQITAVRPEGRNMRIPRSALAKYLKENTWHAQEKALVSSASTESKIGMSAMDAVRSSQQEQRIERALNAF